MRDILNGSWLYITQNALPHEVNSLTGPLPNVSSSFGFIFSASHFLPAFLPLLSSHSSPSRRRQSGSVRSGQVISGLIGRLMLLQKPGTLTCLSSSRVHFLPSQTCWRLAETQTTVLFLRTFLERAKKSSDIGAVNSIIGGKYKKWMLLGLDWLPWLFRPCKGRYRNATGTTASSDGSEE